MAEESRCPYCDELIRPGAKKCKHCGEWLVEGEARTGVTGGTGSGRTGGGSASADPISQVRQALASRYEITGEIGRGGMATVYRAVQKNLEREVALKVLPGQFTHDEEFTERFHREARSAAALNHPNIITIHDEGVEGGVHYMAMEYIAGTDLRQRIKERGALDVEEIRRLIVPVAQGLAYAHGKRMVHRDIKSSNILIGEGDRPVLTDFGIARAAESTKLTQTGTVIGTPEYMSPEQARGDGLDQRADIYSLGVVLYEAASGRLPFRADTALGLIHKITTEEAPRVETVKEDVKP
jgi:eukaryotic-like serine/threonine-protein kinase